MMREEMEALSALVDGEPVDPKLLEQALARPEAAALLVDFVRLGQEVRGDRVVPSEAAVERLGRTLQPPRLGWATMAALAAAVLVALLVPFWRGSDASAPRGETRRSEESVPVPDRVLKFERGRDWN